MTATTGASPIEGVGEGTLLAKAVIDGMASGRSAFPGPRALPPSCTRLRLAGFVGFVGFACFVGVAGFAACRVLNTRDKSGVHQWRPGWGHAALPSLLRRKLAQVASQKASKVGRYPRSVRQDEDLRGKRYPRCIASALEKRRTRSRAWAVAVGLGPECLDGTQRRLVGFEAVLRVPLPALLRFRSSPDHVLGSVIPSADCAGTWKAPGAFCGSQVGVSSPGMRGNPRRVLLTTETGIAEVTSFCFSVSPLSRVGLPTVPWDL